MENKNQPDIPTTEFTELNHNLSRRHQQTQEEFLERYVSLTDTLIQRIQNFETDKDGKPVPADTVIFLDKSARPVAWMAKEFWPLLSEKEEGAPEGGSIPKIPEFKFLNIDRLPWRKDKNVSTVEHPENFKSPTTDDIEGLRAIFSLGDEGETLLDNKKVIVVDEVRDTGDTGDIAIKLLTQAFPKAQFKLVYWMDEYRMAPDGSKQVLDVPVWYSDTRESGRGVIGQAPARSTHANKSKRLAVASHQFLSTRPHYTRSLNELEKQQLTDLNDQLEQTNDEHQRSRIRNQIKEFLVQTVDTKALKLRKEIGALASKVASLEIVPPLHNQNFASDQEYIEKRRQVINKRKHLEVFDK